MLNYVTIFKTGGDYTKRDVISLATQVKKYLNIPHEFICYSNIPIEHELITRRELHADYPGTWIYMVHASPRDRAWP